MAAPKFRIGIVTTDPYRITDDFETNGIEYALISGENKPGKKTSFVTLTKIDRKYRDILKSYSLTEEFLILKTPEELVKYIKDKALSERQI